MKNIMFSKEPGQLFDLYFLFTLRFNKEFCLAKFANPEKYPDDFMYYNSLLQKFSPINDDFSIFFELPESQKGFFSTYYFDPYIEQCFNGSFTFKTLQELLRDTTQVAHNLAEFYLKQNADRVFEDEIPCIEKLDAALQECHLKPNIMVGLYRFFMHPETILKKLTSALFFIKRELDLIYDKNTDKLEKLQKGLNSEHLERVATVLKKGRHQSIDITYCSNARISFVLLHKNCLKTEFNNNSADILFGSDYLGIIEYLADKNKALDPTIIGNTIAEPNRIKILDYLLQRGETSIKDITKEFKFTHTNTYYHISLMLKSGILKSRNQGRTVFYSVNKAFFRDLINALEKYSN